MGRWGDGEMGGLFREGFEKGSFDNPIWYDLHIRPLAKVLIKSIQDIKSTISFPLFPIPYSLFPDFCKKSIINLGISYLKSTTPKNK